MEVYSAVLLYVKSYLVHICVKYPFLGFCVSIVYNLGTERVILVRHEEVGVLATEVVVERPLVYSVAEAARVLSISKVLAYQLIREGRISAIRLSRRRLVVPRKALEALLDGGGPM